MFFVSRLVSAMCKLFQVDYPELVASKVIISMSEGASADLKIILDGLNFHNSYWIFYGVNLNMINCHAASLVLKLKHLKHAIIQNCTFGNWTFSKVQNAIIKSCNNVFDEGISTSLKFYNSSAFVENITIEHDTLIGDLNGIVVYNYSFLHIEQSKFINNTVKRGIIKTVKSSSLIISNCTVLGNHGTEYPGVIYVNESFVFLKNTFFKDNTAINEGGAIFIENMSFLQIKNCNFKSNWVHGDLGVGGAILSLNSSIDVSYSIFDSNKAYQGGAIYQQNNSTMKLNQCFFIENSETAVAGLSNSAVYILNSIFQNN